MAAQMSLVKTGRKYLKLYEKDGTPHTVEVDRYGARRYSGRANTRWRKKQTRNIARAEAEKAVRRYKEQRRKAWKEFPKLALMWVGSGVVGMAVLRLVLSSASQ